MIGYLSHGSERRAEMMHGVVEVQSFLSKGSTFWFTAFLPKQSGGQDEQIELTFSLKGKRFADG